MKHTLQYALIASFMLMPYAFICYRYGTANPFHLSGKHFLLFYICQMCGNGTGILMAGRVRCYDSHTKALKDQKAISALLILAGILTGLARICQGIYNHKPTGYLTGLLILNIFLCCLLWKFSRLRRQ